MNFCEGCLSPRIMASKPGGDDREVSNLISCDIAAHRKGFMGEYFIRPPVDISLEFAVPIDISHINLEARLEHMCSTGFVIFTRSENMMQDQQKLSQCGASSNLYNPSSSGLTSINSSSNTIKPVDSHISAFSTSLYSENFPSGASKGQLKSSDCCREETDDIYFCVGKFFTQVEDKIVLRNPHYKHWMGIPMPVLNNVTHDSKVYSGTMRHPNRQALRCVKNMIIRITRTAEKGPPVLHSVEVWGQPGISTEKAERKKLLKKWADRVKMEECVPTVPRLYNSDPEKKNFEVLKKHLKKQDSLEIPEDFLDPLTCDIMTIPLLLPSGHSIDAHTLERFISNEATWGRPPSDPFTGVPFKENVQPSPNVPLKARIDRFMLVNADTPEVQRSAHTVGPSNNFYNQECSSQRKFQNLEDRNDHPFIDNRKRIHDEVLGTDQTDMLVYSKNLRKGDSSGASVKNIASLSEVTDGVKEVAESDNIIACKNKATLHGKSKYVPMYKSMQNYDVLKRDNENAALKLSVKNQSVVSKATANRARLQALNDTANSMKKPSHHSTFHGGGISSGHHRLVRMIGGALSITHGRTVTANSIPVHQSNAKPSNLVCGDSKPQHFDPVSHRFVTCLCGTKDGLYKLPCDHITCRTCLLQQTKGSEVECNICKKVSKKSEVTKHHEKSIFSM